MGEKKLRIAWFSHLARPGQDAASMSQHCSDLVLPYLRDLFDIEIFSGLYSGDHLGVPRFHYLTAYQRHRCRPFDVFFYQLEDGPLGRAPRMQIGIMPGVTWVHDLFLDDLGAEGTHRSPWEHTLSQMFDPSVPFVDRDEVLHQYRGAARRETSLSPYLLFSSRWTLREFGDWLTPRLEYVPGGHRAEYVPVPVRVGKPESSSRKTDRLEVLAVGVSNCDSRIHKALPALAALSTPWHLTWVVETVHRAGAELLLDECDVREHVTIIEGNSPRQWNELLARSDVALHLNNPNWRLSPYVQLSLAAEVPVVVMKYASGEDLPEGSVFSIVSGTQETIQMQRVFESIAHPAAPRYGTIGRGYVEREHDPQKVARALEKHLRQAAPLLVDVMRRWEVLYRNSEIDLLREVREIVDAPVPGLPSSYDTIVEPFLEELRRTPT